jgi:hypothetical protein
VGVIPLSGVVSPFLSSGNTAAGEFLSVCADPFYLESHAASGNRRAVYTADALSGGGARNLRLGAGG